MIATCLFAQKPVNAGRRKGASVRPTLSCGVVVLHRPAQGELHYLLLRAFDYWDFPKGMMEAGESPLQAAVREVREETALSCLYFHWGYVYRETQPYNHGRKIARYYIAETMTDEVTLLVNPLLGRPEHSEYLWANREQAWKLLTPRVRSVLRWADGVMA